MRYSLGNASDLPIAERAAVPLGILGHPAGPLSAGVFCLCFVGLGRLTPDGSAADPAVLLAVAFAFVGVQWVWFSSMRRGARALRAQQEWHASLPFEMTGYTFGVARGGNIFLTFRGGVERAARPLQDRLREVGLPQITYDELDDGQLRLRLKGSARSKTRAIHRLLSEVLLPLHGEWPLKSVEF